MLMFMCDSLVLNNYAPMYESLYGCVATIHGVKSFAELKTCVPCPGSQPLTTVCSR